MQTFTYLKKYYFYLLLAGMLGFTACNDDEVPPEEDELEVITNVSLVFTNNADAADVVTATAVDPDGEGVQDLQVQGEITLTAGATYTLTYVIQNALETPAEDIGEEIEDEDDEHQFFYSFTDGAFTSPMGNGNIDTSSDPINYLDQDDNSNPVGLSTSWTAGAASTGGTFRAVLKHQPDIKTSSTGFNDGDTDFDLTFVLNIQ